MCHKPSHSHSIRTCTYAQFLHTFVEDACAAVHQESERTNKPVKEGVVLGERPLEQPKWGYSRRWSGMGQACHGVVVDHSQPSLVVVARTSDRLGVAGSRATSLAEVGRENIDRREGGK
jgi:hypothetical protein